MALVNKTGSELLILHIMDAPIDGQPSSSALQISVEGTDRAKQYFANPPKDVGGSWTIKPSIYASLVMSCLDGNAALIT
jgi:hypothetical protein